MAFACATGAVIGLKLRVPSDETPVYGRDPWWLYCVIFASILVVAFIYSLCGFVGTSHPKSVELSAFASNIVSNLDDYVVMQAPWIGEDQHHVVLPVDVEVQILVDYEYQGTIEGRWKLAGAQLTVNDQSFRGIGRGQSNWGETIKTEGVDFSRADPEVVYSAKLSQDSLHKTSKAAAAALIVTPHSVTAETFTEKEANKTYEYEFHTVSEQEWHYLLQLRKWQTEWEVFSRALTVYVPLAAALFFVGYRRYLAHKPAPKKRKKKRRRRIRPIED